MNAVELGENRHVLDGAQLHVRSHRLGNDANALANSVWIANNIETFDSRRAFGRRHQRGQHPDERGFTGAIRPKQAEDLALPHFKLHVVDGAKIAEALRDFVYFHGCHKGSVLCWKNDVRCHPDCQPAVTIVTAKTNFECLDITLRPADVTLSCVVGVSPDIKHLSFALSARRESHRECVAQTNMLDVSLLDVRSDP